MAHFAKIENDLVTEVIVADQVFVDSLEGQWIKTSYNTRGGIYYIPNTDIPDEDQSKALRKNYAGVGFRFDPVLDAFIPPKPYESWTLNEDTCLWEAPIPMPKDTNDDKTKYYWDEPTLSWKPIEQGGV